MEDSENPSGTPEEPALPPEEMEDLENPLETVEESALTPEEIVEFETIIRAWQHGLERYAYVLMSNPTDEAAHDAVLDTFLDMYKLFKKRFPPFVLDGDEGSRRRWLYQRVTQRVIDWIRKHPFDRNGVPFDGFEEEIIDQRAANDSQSFEMWEVIKQALGYFSRRDGMIILLRLPYIDLPFAQIAKIFDILEARARKIHSRKYPEFKQILRDLLKGIKPSIKSRSQQDEASDDNQ